MKQREFDTRVDRALWIDGLVGQCPFTALNGHWTPSRFSAFLVHFDAIPTGKIS
jgi:hypothetical protein